MRIVLREAGAFVKQILVVKNISREGPGMLAEIAQERNFELEVVEIDSNFQLPEISKYSGLVVLGGPDSANDENEKIDLELGLVRKCLEIDMPYLGICLGMQILVKAVGGHSIKSPVKEVGFLDIDGNQNQVELTIEGKSDPMFNGLPTTLNVFQLHGETVELTSDLVVLATGKHCPIQAVKYSEHAYGIQSHFELTEEMLQLWLNEDDDLKVLNREELLKNFHDIKRSYDLIGSTLFNNFLDIVESSSSK